MASKGKNIGEMVEQKINGKKVVMFSKTYCGYCAKAKNAFKNYLGKELSKEDYEIMEIDKDNDCEKIQSCLQNKTGARSVPRVFINGKFVGGGDDIVRLHNSGKLAPLLTATKS